MGQMLLALKKASAVPYELKTDSVLYQPQKRRRVELDQARFRDLDTLYTKAYPVACPPVQLQAICSDDRPFRQQAAAERDLLSCEPVIPARSWSLVLQSRSWSQLLPEEGERRVLEGRSLLAQGIAGTV